MSGKGELERAVMEALWGADRPLLIRELMERVNAGADRPLAYTTVQTVADRLVTKDLLARQLAGNAYRYHPVRTREEHVAGVMLQALSGMPDHGPVLARFADSMDPADAGRLLEALSRRALGALTPQPGDITSCNQTVAPR